MEPAKTLRERAARIEDLIRLLVSDWRPSPRQRVWAIRIACGSGILVAIGYLYDITLWDWAQLLIVPAVIAGVGIWFNRQQRERELEIAARRTQDETLQAYLDVMSQLHTDEKRPLSRSEIGDSLSSVARARTLTVLPRLDGERKARVVLFLYEAGLIVRKRPIIDLLRADLRGAKLRDASLRGADLQGADLQGADLFHADLKWADLSFADLRGANLKRVDLLGAVLSSTKLSAADLRRANLRGAEGWWTVGELRAAKSLEEATMPDGEILGGEAHPDGPTFEEWVRNREDLRKEGAKNT